MRNTRQMRGGRRAHAINQFFTEGPFLGEDPRRGGPFPGDDPRRSGGPFGDGPHSRGHRGGPMHRGGRRGRAQRGDVRAAVLQLLADEPMHGYQLMQAIADRTGGAWKPSPGAIYPTISQLEDEGLVRVEKDAGRKLVSLTDEGRAHLDDPANEQTDPFAGHSADGNSTDLRGALRDLQTAARVVAVSGTDAQITAAHKVLAEARKSLYLLLAEDTDPAPDATDQI
ncbi:DNA-binding PadR family transcriptional regulator [Rhodococcus sp. SMB37]|uniref:PadR family transcriptional regulator n=1 Tax=Rhodococcus sp. SMB37 TaxID=2512213 RepID=UPI0010EF3CE5|nr:PadR family transcriptional regulator [Rhodococcus sp. SMB37]TCN49047.1 DNA-binding PadR family transcriptional regulator [Rhodococcus sp. SMB37]